MCEYRVLDGKSETLINKETTPQEEGGLDSGVKFALYFGVGYTSPPNAVGRVLSEYVKSHAAVPLLCTLHVYLFLPALVCRCGDTG